MGRSLLFKTVGIGLLALVLMVPVAMVRDLVSERQARRHEAVRDIAAGWGGSQTLTGPYVAVPYRRTWTETSVEKVEGRRVEHTVQKSDAGVLRITPEAVTFAVESATSEKARGVHRARLYTAKVAVRGELALPARNAVQEAAYRYEWDVPRFVFGISDPRGVRTLSPLDVDGRAVDLAPGAFDRAAGERSTGTGVHAVLAPLDPDSSRRHAFAFTLEVAGLEAMGFVPVAQDTEVTLAADWPHPSFHGAFLPASHEITASGFKARWKVSRYAANGAERLRACRAPNECYVALSESLGVSFVEPVGIYQQLDRTTKYGFLFVGLVFAAFLLFELLRRLAIHPVQYALVGLSIGVFFLLVTALSEHVPFGIAYLAGAAGCVGIVTYYLVRVLASRAAGLAFGAGLGALYGVLYLLLGAEDYALLAGAVLVFLLLAATMAGTRRVDWYRVVSAPRTPAGTTA